VAKVLGYIIMTIALLAGAVVVIGVLLPKAHAASVRIHINQPAATVYDAIADVTTAPEWRTGLDSVRIISHEPLKWQESSKFGAMTYIMDDMTRPTRMVARIADTGEGFGGSWTYQVTPDNTGSVVVITENGEVYNPLFRFMSKFVFGHYSTLETFATDLGKHFGETVTPERIEK
jgi:hypothetical protein